MAEAGRTFPATYSMAPIIYHGPKKKRLSTGKIILGSVAVFTVLGGFIADMNKTHMKNPDWPPHAKFHDAMSITLGAFLGTASLYFLSRKTFDSHQDIQLSALLPSMYWAAQGVSFFYRKHPGWKLNFLNTSRKFKDSWSMRNLHPLRCLL
ncbi:DUF6640 family protein [Planococcus sp. 107-1]|uniref:DUF6640 family protein n=1 Tax=Planococcus sp. 107-1 TaxID=2908840 RepID=UPI001F3CC427|nr:DUF6640 family protein [Planococcus sp. 107-1]UJF25708.1 hypothetical protein L0M13_10700 [Planococcus sp. 107-1]